MVCAKFNLTLLQEHSRVTIVIEHVLKNYINQKTRSFRQIKKISKNRKKMRNKVDRKKMFNELGHQFYSYIKNYIFFQTNIPNIKHYLFNQLPCRIIGISPK